MLASHWQMAGAPSASSAFSMAASPATRRPQPSGKPNVSRLSPHLHWGEVSVNRVWHAAR